MFIMEIMLLKSFIRKVIIKPAHCLFYFSFLEEYLSFLFTVSKTENFVEILDTSVRLGPKSL